MAPILGGVLTLVRLSNVRTALNRLTKPHNDMVFVKAKLTALYNIDTKNNANKQMLDECTSGTSALTTFQNTCLAAIANFDMMIEEKASLLDGVC